MAQTMVEPGLEMQTKLTEKVEDEAMHQVYLLNNCTGH